MGHLPASRALVRKISRSLAACELVHLPRQAFDLPRAARQHEGYVRALEAAGVQVTVWPEEPALADSCFVEDPLLMLDEVAILCRLGAASRERESEIMAPEIKQFRPVLRIEAPGTLEGGDVLRIGKTLFTGLSRRTNREGLEQLRRLTAPFGYEVSAVEVKGCLHLKTGATSPGRGLLLANPAWVALAPFRHLEILPVPTEEPWGANTLPVNDRVLVAASAPHTAGLLRARGLRVQVVDVSELQKAEAGLTCLSVLFL
jgi:dimethylargininase